MKHCALPCWAALAFATAANADEIVQPESVGPATLQYDSYYAQPAEHLPLASLPNALQSPPAPTPGVEPEPASWDAAACPEEFVCPESYGCRPRRLSGSCLGGCCLGDAFTLKSWLDPCGCCPIDFGGWTQIGYHSSNARLSRTANDGLAFNDRDDRLNLHQQWFWAEKVADGSGGLDWGFRADLMYGTDAASTQAFGAPAGTWDFQNGWDRGGGYGWAMPQLYGEVAYGDLSVIAGHFFTLVGYEVVTAPDNFFYSHALTMFNSEPFTHTGALATYSGFENVELYGGWTLGWDTGFTNFEQGNSFLGGLSVNVSDDITFTYIATAGNLGARSSAGNGNASDGYSHSIVIDFALTDRLNYVFQSDYVGIDSQGGLVSNNDQIGINQYLFYTLNDCWAVGGRVEWWRNDGFDYQELTLGLNYRPHANVVVRPEIRWDWAGSDAAAVNAGFSGDGEYDNTAFGIDCIVTY